MLNNQYVYLCGEVPFGDRVKIGISNRPSEQRLKEMQTGSPSKLKMYFTTWPFPSAEEYERSLHKLLKKLGRHIHLEWFKMTEMEMDILINEMAEDEDCINDCHSSGDMDIFKELLNLNTGTREELIETFKKEKWWKY